MLHLSLLTLILKILSLRRRDIWELAKAGQKANKGQDKGRIWAMVMQLKRRAHSWIWQLWRWQQRRSQLMCAIHALHVLACVAARFDPQIMHVLTLLLSHWHVARIKRSTAPLRALMCLYRPVDNSLLGYEKVNQPVCQGNRTQSLPSDQCSSPQGLTFSQRGHAQGCKSPLNPL